MKITLPKIFRMIDLADYDPSLAGKSIPVQVNLSKEFVARHNEEMLDDKEATLAFYADWWSRGDDPETHWTPDELRELSDADPSLWDWLVFSAWSLVTDFRNEMVKKAKPSQPVD